MDQFADPVVADATSQAETETEADTGSGQVQTEVVGGGAGGETPSGSSVLQMSADGQTAPAAASASEQAYGAHEQTHAAQKKKGGGTNSHNGGFTGFGAEFEPYSYTDPHMNHGKLDPKVKKLGAQHTRIFVPWKAIETGLLGLAGPDTEKDHIDQLTEALGQHPGDPQIEKKLANAKKTYAKDKSFVESFIKTVQLAGKHTTINLTFFGAVDQPERTKTMAHIIKYFADQGYDHLQTTLENEPNGGTKHDKSYRGPWNAAAATGNHAKMRAAIEPYVQAYENLDKELKTIGARDQVKVVGGDMVGQHRADFFRSIVADGMNKFVDAYSLHIYWGLPGHPFSRALHTLKEMQQMQAKIAPGKNMEVTEFGRKQSGPGGNSAAPRNEESAFEEGLFALSAVNDGYTGLVKWDAFYDGAHHAGDGKGDPGKFYLIGGPNKGYATDAEYSLIKMFTHAVDPGWHAHGANRGEQGANVFFRSPDGTGGAVLAMSRGGETINTNTLPAHHKLRVTTWTNGHIQTAEHAHGQPVHVPAMGAVAVTTKPA